MFVGMIKVDFSVGVLWKDAWTERWESQWFRKHGVVGGWTWQLLTKELLLTLFQHKGFWNSPNSKLESRNTWTKLKCMLLTFVSWLMWINYAMRWLRDHPRLIFPWNLILFWVNGQSPSWRIWGSWGYDFKDAKAAFLEIILLLRRNVSPNEGGDGISKARTSPNEGSSEKNGMKMMVFPIGSMCGKLTYIDHKNHSNLVATLTIKNPIGYVDSMVFLKKKQFFNFHYFTWHLRSTEDPTMTEFEKYMQDIHLGTWVDELSTFRFRNGWRVLFFSPTFSGIG